MSSTHYIANKRSISPFESLSFFKVLSLLNLPKLNVEKADILNSLERQLLFFLIKLIVFGLFLVKK